MISRLSWTGRACAVLACLFVALALPDRAEARWLRAESPRFVVYSDGAEADLREYVRKLETFDALLRALHGIPDTAPVHRKLPVYLVRSRAQIRLVAPGRGSSVAGFYMPSTEDIFAVALRQGREDDFLFHEYVHHFMLANFPYAYPSWLVEGYAEFFMTATMDDEHVTWGQFNANRAAWLTGSAWLPTAEVLKPKHRSELRSQDIARFYAQAWLITHYFMSDPERRKQLDAYVRAVGAGEDPVLAMEKAAGMPVDTLHRTLRDYAAGRISYSRASARSFRAPEVTVTAMSPAADDLLLLSLRLKVPVPQAERPRTAEMVRREAAKHPGDPLAAVTLAHAELHFGDPPVAERVLAEFLAANPEHVEALQWMAQAKLEAAHKATEPAKARSLRGQARALLARAYKADDFNYLTFLLLARSREPEADYPNDNDIQTWSMAYAIAPQVGSIRLGAARALMLRGRHAQAIPLLEPIANNPHGGRSAQYARDMIERARAGRPPLALGQRLEDDAPDDPPSRTGEEDAGEDEDGQEGGEEQEAGET